MPISQKQKQHLSILAITVQQLVNLLDMDIVVNLIQFIMFLNNKDKNSFFRFYYVNLAQYAKILSTSIILHNKLIIRSLKNLINLQQWNLLELSINNADLFQFTTCISW